MDTSTIIRRDLGSAMSIEEQTRAASENLGHILEWIDRFDHKSSIVLGATTGMLGLLASFAPPVGGWTVPMSIVAAVAVLCLTAALVNLYLATYPRTKGRSTSLLFFGSIARHDLETYRSGFLGQGPNTYLSDLLGQCHRNAEILTRKFANLRCAYLMLYVGVFPWAVAIYLFRSVS